MKKGIFILIVIVLLLIINGLIDSIVNLWQKQDVLTSAQKQLQQQQLENAKLKGELSYVQTPQFIDQTAHNKLFLVKPGEEQVFLPQDITSQPQSQPQTQNIPNWQKWVNLFF